MAKGKAMAIKRYSGLFKQNGSYLPYYGEMVKLEDHLNSHRFDEAAERVKFIHSMPEDEVLDIYSSLSGFVRFAEPDIQHKWEGWRERALAREKEFVG